MFPRRIATGLLLTASLAMASCGSGGEEVRADGGDTPNETVPTTVVDPSTTLAPSTSEAPLGAGPYPIATLEISFAPADGKATDYTISCLGDTATVIGDVAVAGEAACLALNDGPVRERLIGGVPADRICTEIYGSADTASISGVIDGESVETEVDRTNGCGIDDWDVVLAAVLPAVTPS